MRRLYRFAHATSFSPLENLVLHEEIVLDPQGSLGILFDHSLILVFVTSDFRILNFNLYVTDHLYLPPPLPILAWSQIVFFMIVSNKRYHNKIIMAPQWKLT